MAYRMQATQEALVIVDGSWMNIHDDVQQYLQVIHIQEVRG
jgi:hypothetical protein